MGRGYSLSLAAVGLSLLCVATGAALNNAEPRSAMALFGAGVTFTVVAAALLSALIIHDRSVLGDAAGRTSSAVAGPLDFSGVVLFANFDRPTAPPLSRDGNESGNELLDFSGGGASDRVG